MIKTFSDLVFWLIPIRHIRNNVRLYHSHYFRKIDSYLRILKEGKPKKQSITLYVKNDWITDENRYHENFCFNIIKQNFIPDISILWYKPDIECFSVVGNRKEINLSKAKVKIFFTGECTGKEAIDKHWREYEDDCISDVDLSLSFNRRNEEILKNYIRLPLWVLFHFGFILDKNTTKDMVKEKVYFFNNLKFNKTKNISLIASHDKTGIRKEIYDEISKIATIDCPSKFMHNDDTLKNNYSNNKLEYLKNYKFNICPENTISDGYITEKLFDAFASGCIPIYSGDPKIEPDVVEKSSVLFWKKNEDNSELIKEIKLLSENEKLYNSFIIKPRLKETATDYIWSIQEKIYSKLENIINTKLL